MDKEYLDENLILGSSPQQMPGKSKILYEDIIRKNFEIIQSFLKKFTTIFNKHEFFENEIAGLIGRLGKLEIDVENLHTEHRKGNLNLYARMDGFRNKMDGLESRVRGALQEIESAQNKMEENTFISTLEKTKPIFKLVEGNDREIQQKQADKKTKNNAFSKKSLKQESNEDHSSRNSGSTSKKQKSQYSINKRRISLKKEGRIGKQLGRRKKGFCGSKRRSLISLRKKNFKNIDEINRNGDNSLDSEDKDRILSIPDIQINKLGNENKAEKQEQADQKIVDNLISSQFSITFKKELQETVLLDRLHSLSENPQFVTEKLKNFGIKFDKYLTKAEFDKCLGEIEEKILKCEDIHYQNCADKVETKRALLYLEKKINKVNSPQGSLFDQNFESKTGQNLQTSRCLVCNRLFPKQHESRSSNMNNEERSKKVVYYGSMTPESLPSQPLSLHHWKRKTADILKNGKFSFNNKRESKV